MLVTSIFVPSPKANPLCKFSCDHYTNISLLQLLWLSPRFFAFPLNFLLDVWDATEFSYTEFFFFLSANSEQVDQVCSRSEPGEEHKHFWVLQAHI